jgi:putative transposase
MPRSWTYTHGFIKEHTGPCRPGASTYPNRTVGNAHSRLPPLATQGKLQSEIARTLGVSVMTLHRWRKAPPGPQPALEATPEGREPDRTGGADDRIAELQLENLRLRRLVTDLLLEKIRLEEVAERQESPRGGTR